MLGSQWVAAAGASAEAVFGIFLCFAAASGEYLFKKAVGDRIDDQVHYLHSSYSAVDISS